MNVVKIGMGNQLDHQTIMSRASESSAQLLGNEILKTASIPQRYGCDMDEEKTLYVC